MSKVLPFRDRESHIWIIQLKRYYSYIRLFGHRSLYDTLTYRTRDTLDNIHIYIYVIKMNLRQ